MNFPSQPERFFGDCLASDCNRDFPPPWFMRRDYESDPRFQAIEEDLKPLARQFMRDGYVVLKADFPLALADQVVSEFKRFAALNSDYFDPHRDEFGFLQRIINLHLLVPVLTELFATATTTLRLQDALFGAPTSIYTSLYYERGSWQPIHRDTPYFTTRPEYCYFGTWFALEDANLENGCLQVIQGGHLLPELDRSAFAAGHRSGEVGEIDPELFNLYQTEMERRCTDAGLESKAVPIDKGDVLIWHPQLPHGGMPILDRTLTRHSIVMHTVPVGCPVFQASAFFNPAKNLPGTAAWPLEERFGRFFADHGIVDVMHVAPRRVDEFRTA
jgi:hypothetical protein